MVKPSFYARKKITLNKIKDNAIERNKIKNLEIANRKKDKEKRRKIKGKQNIGKKEQKEEINERKKIVRKNIKELSKDEKKLVKLIIETANKNWITDVKLNKAGIPPELHDSIRIMSEKIHGNRIIFLEKPLKKISVVAKGGVIVIAGVTAMQIPGLIREYKNNKTLLERHRVKYNLKEFMGKDLKGYEYSIEVPSNVFSKESWGNYLKGPGISFAGGALVAASTIAVLSFVIKRKINAIKTRRVLKKKGILP